MIPYSRPKLSDLYTLSKTLYCTLHSGTYLYSPYMTVPPQPLGVVCPQGASSRDARSEGSCPSKTWRYLSHLVPSITPMAILFSCAFCSTNCQGSDMEGGGVSALHVNYYFFMHHVCITFFFRLYVLFFTVVLFPFFATNNTPSLPCHTHTHTPLLPPSFFKWSTRETVLQHAKKAVTDNPGLTDLVLEHFLFWILK